MSVRPSVASVTLVDQESGPHGLEILETDYTDNYPNTFALSCPKDIYLLPGEHGEILGRQEVGWEKVARSISDTRKDREKVTMDGI